MVRLGQRFAHAVAVLIGMWHDHFGDAADWVRGEHERKMRLLALAKQISLQRLRSLARLQRPPVTRSLLAILASVMLDRVVVGALALVLTIALARSVTTWWHAVPPILGILGFLSFAAFAWRKLRSAVDPSTDLRDCAPRVARLFPAAFVVMGHTHLPEMRPTALGTTTYVNLGAWAEEEPSDGAAPALPATRTHLVVVPCPGGPVGELLTWNSGIGPASFRTSGMTGGFPAKT